MDRLRPTLLAALVALVLAATACGATLTATAPSRATPSRTTPPRTHGHEHRAGKGSEELYPDVVGVEAVHDGDGSWTFRVTLSSPYDSPERYADAWRVVGPDGTVLGERILTHDHAAEQPFTRSQSGITIPADVTFVTVEGRDQVSGWGGATMDVTVQR